jgi:O-antigen ligase
LAAWLFLAIFALYFLLFYHTKSTGPRYKDFWWIAVYAILLFGLFFTFSRIIIGLWALGAVVWFFLKFVRESRPHVVAITVATFIIAVLFSAIYWPQVRSRIHVSAGEEAVTQRIFYNEIAESVTTENPVLGVGIGQFVPQLMSRLKHWPANIYQPVHNIYLLIASETGFAGLVSFLLFFAFLFWEFIRRPGFKKAHSLSFLILAFSFLLMGLFDHFLWTIQQGNLIFWMILALISLGPDIV